jgi:signal transduction histidine kinase
MIAASNALWIAQHNGIVRTTAESMKRWEQDHGLPVDYAIFTRADGMRSAECTDAGMGPLMAVTPDGRLWVATLQGLAMIDLRRLPRSANKPLVYLRDTVVGRKSQRPGDHLVLAPGTSHLELAFDAVELSAPHRIRLQYRLDDVDDDWLDAPASHVATYSGMPPGSHTFHIRATNRDGVWDLVGMTYQVTEEPFPYQTAWFRALSLATLFGIACGLYWYRIRQLAHVFNLRLEELVGERTRIARELHDTLLQSFQGLMLHLQVVGDLLPEGKAKSQLEETLQRADQAIAEGRTAVYDLRSSISASNDLAEAMKALSAELSTPGSAVFRLEVEGVPKDLHPIVRDEIYRIAREVLRNAFKHAQARQIETELTYGERILRLRLRDNGKGIPLEILQRGRQGHYGLCGMRERAKQIGGNLEIWSRPGAGTEIELSIPASIAYRTVPRGLLFRFLPRRRS